MTSSTAWPEGVIARYLTAGGATVDIKTPDSDYRSDVDCTGCGRGKTITGWAADETIQHCREWAQPHAAACRAMPKPTN